NLNVLTWSYTLNTPDGTSHHFVPDPIENDNEAGYCLPHPTILYTDDGSGWVLNLDPDGGVIKAIGKDGTVVGTFEDSNGNQVQKGPSTATDTLGRQFNSD